MKKLSKIVTGFLAVMLALGVMGPLPVKAAEGLDVTTPDNKALTYQAGQSQDFVLNLANTGDIKLTDITVSPKLRSSSDKWPFKIDYQSYTGKIDSLEPSGNEGSQGTVNFNFTQKENIPTATYSLLFKITANDENGNPVITDKYVSFYVNTTAKPQDPAKEDPKGKEPSDQGGSDDGSSAGGIEPMSASAGGFDNGGASYTGGGSSASGSVPRVIVTGFDTDPAEVKAGSNFTLTIHLKNTSKATKVSNMLFDLAAPTEGTDEQTTAPAFLPASGSSSIYLDGIKADGTADISIALNAKADLVQKPYSINMSMKYEDSNAAQIEGASSISIPVKQDARFEFSDFEITPETIAIGEEGNVSCNLYNLGRIKLYNVKAVFEGKGIKKEEVFIGNVEPGATASIDAMLEGEKVTGPSDKIKMTMTYEDEAGTASKIEKELSLEITESTDDMSAMMDAPVEENKGLPIIPIIVVVAVAIVAVVIIIVLKKKKKRLLSEEEEGLLDELDGPSEDE